MSDVLSQKVTTDDIVEAYNQGVHPYALVEKFGVPIETVSQVINKAFPQDVDGEDKPVQVLAEGENPTVETTKSK